MQRNAKSKERVKINARNLEIKKKNTNRNYQYPWKTY